MFVRITCPAAGRWGSLGKIAYPFVGVLVLLVFKFKQNHSFIFCAAVLDLRSSLVDRAAVCLWRRLQMAGETDGSPADTQCVVCSEMFAGKTYCKQHCPKCCSDLRAIRRALGEDEQQEGDERAEAGVKSIFCWVIELLWF